MELRTRYLQLRGEQSQRKFTGAFRLSLGPNSKDETAKAGEHYVCVYIYATSRAGLTPSPAPSDQQRHITVTTLALVSLCNVLSEWASQWSSCSTLHVGGSDWVAWNHQLLGKLHASLSFFEHKKHSLAVKLEKQTKKCFTGLKHLQVKTWSNILKAVLIKHFSQHHHIPLDKRQSHQTTSCQVNYRTRQQATTDFFFPEVIQDKHTPNSPAHGIRGLIFSQVVYN